MAECEEKHFSNNTLWKGIYCYSGTLYAVHINTTNLPSGEFSCWGLLLAQRPENFCARGRTEASTRIVCGQTRCSYNTPPPSRPVCPREKLQMRHSNFYEEYSLVAVLFLFPECAARCLAFPFSFRLSLASRYARKRERRKGERAEDKLVKIRKCHEVCVGIYRRRYTCDAFSPRLRISFPPFFLSLSPFRQITDFRRCQAFRFMYIQPPQWQRAVLRGNITGQRRIYRDL